MKRIRTIEGVIAELRKVDPGCAITEHCLRILVKQGQIPSARAGKKYLVALDDVENFFNFKGDIINEIEQQHT